MPTDAIRLEQQYLDGLYARVEELREETLAALTATNLADADGPRGLVDRDAHAARLSERRAGLDRAEHGLCFGRLDRRDGSVTYIGRMGLRDADLNPLLVDWRAPVASDFYTATAASGTDVQRRRHIRTTGRTVVGVNDELLDLDHAPASDLVGEGALMEALTAHRTGRMGDIVATLQGEQDEVIRADADGVLVVQGGPGTGKTAVALHRAAYLLYTYPRIAEQGVLVVGPSPVFLAYIEQVLPSLGETQVVLATPNTVLPGTTVTAVEDPGAAVVKGDVAMAGVVASAVRARQEMPDGVDVTFSGDVLRVAGPVLAGAAEQARRTGLGHNLARLVFAEEIWPHLTDLVLDRDRQLLEDTERGFEAELRKVDAAIAKQADQLPSAVEGAGTEVTGTAGEHEVMLVRRELEQDHAVAAVVDRLWPALTAEDLLEDLFEQIADRPELAPDLTEADRRVLARERGAGWSAADVPLLDEAAELLGVDDTVTDARLSARRREELRYAQQVLAASGVKGVSAEDLAGRFRERDSRSLAERAAADRTWAYGHLIVDEAQELSAMQWRMLLRRVPSGSLTVVGDVHQTSAATGTTSWDALVAAHPRRRWRRVDLSVSYRTPQAVLDAAAPVLRALDPDAPAPVAARAGGEVPWRVHSRPDALTADVIDLARAELDALDGGHLAVVAPAARTGELGDALDAALDATTVSFGADPELTAEVVVLTPEQAKGLEFDGVLVVDVEAVASGPRGLGALYVAMTRPTTRLGLIHLGPVPEVLAGLPERSR
ncbi:ATP-binding domain-containing protein [Occultella aeris]|uniref:Helicase IV n=1 Tax=Occultella aeris TaxID=2761496 RepID=A0A7M4DDZ5_9MICO|nr:ATP-binding domain-containing protein [Occultella aeris]VZO35109.1 Helicase IV [Occultella aeris]